MTTPNSTTVAAPNSTPVSTPTPIDNADQPLVIKENNDQVVTLTLNQPKQFNALSVDVLAALQTELDTIAADSGLRVVVILSLIHI